MGLSRDERDILVEKIMDMRLTGCKPEKIAARLTAAGHPITWTHVARLIREAAADCRANHQELLDQRFLEQDRRVEYLIAMAMRRVRRAAKKGQPFVAMLKAAISLFERQAKLHGLDLHTARGVNQQKDNWLDSAPFESVLNEAERIGLVAPGEFDTTPRRPAGP